MKKYFLNKMSTGKRLAKRSIVGTRVCAPGTDGIWYSGKIEFVKTANEQQSKDASSSSASASATVIPGLTTPARYTVRFDNMKDLAAGELGLVREFRETELIGPGFRTIADVKLRPGQKVFLTYNGRENAGEVLTHDDLKDEVKVRIVVAANAANGANGAAQEVSPKIEPRRATEEKLAPIELTKRLEEVRLLESRRSLRLAVQEKDTDFARLADMAGGDRRRQSNSIDVPFTLTQQNGSRKRRPSYSQDDREYYSINDDDPMDECNAALVLMSLSCSPNSSVHGYETILGTSSGSSTTSWSTGSTSPPLSEDGHSTPPTHHHHELSHHHHYHHSHHGGRASHQGGGGNGGNGANGGEVVRGARTTSLSTSDEGIGMEYNEDMPRKRRASQRIFKCTWKGCGVIYTTCSEITAHVRNAHLGPRKPNEYSDEEDFFFTETEDESDESAPNPPSPPTLSHRDMARPPHEDPEYQRQIVGNYRQGLLSQSQALQAQQQAAQQQQQQQQHQTQQQQQVAAIKPPLPAGLTVAALSGTSSNGTTNGGASSNGGGTNGSSSSSNGSSVSPLMHHNYITTWSQISPTSPQKHVRLSPRPPASYPYPSPNYQHHYQAQVAQQQQQQQQHHQQQLGHIQLSPGSGTGGSAGNGSTAAYQQLLAGAGAAGLNLGSYSGSGSAGGSVSGSAAAAAAGGGPQHRSPVSPNRRTRGENKKCRKVYGMDHKDQWCTQCKWKKACSRFGD